MIRDNDRGQSFPETIRQITSRSSAAWSSSPLLRSNIVTTSRVCRNFFRGILMH